MQEPIPGNTAENSIRLERRVSRLVCKGKRLCQFLFVRRLAIDKRDSLGKYRGPDIMIFEWQEMPPCYRWF